MTDRITIYRTSMAAITFGMLISMFAATTQGDKIILNSGDILKGKITARDDAATTLEHEVFGPLVIPADRIQSVTVTEAAAPAPVEEPTTEAPVAAEQPAAPREDSGFVKFLKEWNTNIEVGFNTSSGDTDSTNFLTAINLEKETDTDIDRFRFRYIYESKDGDKSRDESLTSWQHEWLTQTKWSYYLVLRYETDAFKAWDSRATISGGVGYRYLEIDEDDPIDLTFRVGLGGNREFGSDNSDFNPELAAGGELMWPIDEKSSLESSLYYLQGLDELGKFRILATLDWVYKLNDTVSLKLGLDEEYQSDVAAGDSNNNLKTYGTLVVGF